VHLESESGITDDTYDSDHSRNQKRLSILDKDARAGMAKTPGIYPGTDSSASRAITIFLLREQPTLEQTKKPTARIDIP